MGKKTEKRAEVKSREVSERSHERDFQSTSARALKLLWSPGPCLVLQGAQSSLTRLKYSTLFRNIEAFIWYLHFYDSVWRSGRWLLRVPTLIIPRISLQPDLFKNNTPSRETSKTTGRQQNEPFSFLFLSYLFVLTPGQQTAPEGKQLPSLAPLMTYWPGTTEHAAPWVLRM